MRAVDALLERLEAVEPAGSSRGLERWRAFCPGHQRPPHHRGRGRTLSVAEAEDGTVLVHCHAGCELGQVLGAIGLDPSELFPSEARLARVSGNKGPTHWALADAAAEAAAEALTRAVTFRDVHHWAEAEERLHQFQIYARRAAREDAARVRGARETPGTAPSGPLL